MTDRRQTEELSLECRRLEENCQYTAVTFLIWLRYLKLLRLLCEVAPVIFGALATWKIVSQTSPTWAAVFTFLTTVIPPAYKATKTDAAIEQYTVAAGEFTNLRDRFRQASAIDALGDYNEFERAFNPLVARLEKIRARALTPPNWLFKAAQVKLRTGDYNFAVDEAARNDG